MLRYLLLCALAFMCMPALAQAENEKIDPATYLCAEYQTNEAVLRGEPPLFEGLQIDGYVSAQVGMDIASADTVHVMLGQAYLWCQNRPAEKVVTIWKQLRETGPVPIGDWNATQSTCADMAVNTDDASGFIIWLDGYNRSLQNTTKSILNSDADLQGFIDACMLSPTRTMLEVLQEQAK